MKMTHILPPSMRTATPAAPAQFAAGDDGASLPCPEGAKRYFFPQAEVRVAEVTDSTSGDGIITAVINTADVDRYGTIVDPKGADLKNFTANPILLWCHGYDVLGSWPIGQVLSIEVTDSEIVAKIQFDLEGEASAELYRLYRKKILRGFSIGFIPHSYSSEMIEDRSILRFTSWELVELSACPVPANPAALSRALAEIKSEQLVASLKPLAESANENAAWDVLARSFGPLSAVTSRTPPINGTAASQPGATATPAAAVPSHIEADSIQIGDDADGPIVVSAARQDVGRLTNLLSRLRANQRSSTPAASQPQPAIDWTGRWHAASEVRATPQDRQPGMGCISTSVDGQTRNWLLHHRASGAVSWPAVASCMAELCTRSMDLTAAERDEAYDHLAGHYRELGIVPPERGGQSPERAYDLALMGRQAWLDSADHAWLYVDKRLIRAADGIESALPIFANIETGARQIMPAPGIGRAVDHRKWGTRSTEDPGGYEAVLELLADQQRALDSLPEQRAGAEFSRKNRAAITAAASALEDVGRQLRSAADAIYEQAGSLSSLIADDESSEGDERAIPAIVVPKVRAATPSPEEVGKLFREAIAQGVQQIKSERFARRAGPLRGRQTVSQ